jgi:hypothetical protein
MPHMRRTVDITLLGVASSEVRLVKVCLLKRLTALEREKKM